MKGGPNFWNTVQVEVIGYADTAQASKVGAPERAIVNWPDSHYAPIAALARWIEANFAVPRTCSVEFVDHVGASGKPRRRQDYSGHIGHQHLDGNDHWDPGLFKIDLDPRRRGGHDRARQRWMRDVGRGDRGDDVKVVQAVLVKRGYPPPQTDGVFGRDTEAYVVHFQWKHNLKVDGRRRREHAARAGRRDRPGLGGREGRPEAAGDPGPRARQRPAASRSRRHAEGRVGGQDRRARACCSRAPRVTAAQLEAYVVGRPHGTYPDDKARMIVGLYVKTCKPVGLDPLLVVAQMVLETGNLTSDWSQPPRRNPAGIGVTGEPGEGISFPTWQAAVRAHVGRLLAYCIADGAETPAQLKLIEEALGWRDLPGNLRGAAPTLSGLTGTWAANKQYAAKIVRVAKEIATPPA